MGRARRLPVAAGVHRIVCPLPDDGLKAVNVYAIEDGDGLALVDTGWRDDGILAALTAGFATARRVARAT